jgi:hypothetical protein
MQNLFDMMFGKVDENKQYYDAAMFRGDIGEYLLFVLQMKGLVTEEELKEYKKLFMDEKNRLLIQSMKEFGVKKD